MRNGVNTDLLFRISKHLSIGESLSFSHFSGVSHVIEQNIGKPFPWFIQPGLDADFPLRKIILTYWTGVLIDNVV